MKPLISSTTIDDQVELLENNLRDSLQNLSKLSESFSQLSQSLLKDHEVYTQNLQTFETSKSQIRKDSDLINGKIREFLKNFTDIKEKVSKLISRCPFDLILLRRIPLHPFFVKSDSSNFLIDLLSPKSFNIEQNNGMGLESIYLKAVDIRDNIFDFIQCTQREIRNIELYDDEISEISIDSAVTEISNNIGQIQKLILQINESLHPLPENDSRKSENVQLMERSAYLLKLAQVKNECSEAKIAELQISLQRLTNASMEIKAQKDKKLKAEKNNLSEEKIKLDLLKAQIENCIVVEKDLEKVDHVFKSLDIIHAYPVAYVALLCEMVRRNLFQETVNAYFTQKESLLLKLLETEKQKQNNVFNEIETLVNGSFILNSRYGKPAAEANLILVQSNEQKNEFIFEDIDDLIEILRNELATLKKGDPLSIQYSNFIQTIQKMKTNINNEEISTNLESFKFNDNLGTKLINCVNSEKEKNIVESLKQRIKTLEYKLGDLVDKQINAREYEVRSSTLAQNENLVEPNLKNNFDNFVKVKDIEVGDQVLFLPTTRKDVWSPFFIKDKDTYPQKKYFLSLQSLELLAESICNRSKDWLIGKIVKLDTRKSLGRHLNEFRLEKDYEYFLVHAEPNSASYTNI